MNKLEKWLRLLPRLLLWLLASTLFWSWIFNFLTDTDREHKITLFVGMQFFEERALAAALEENLPGNIRMVQVHSFGYALMDSISLQTSDLYLMTESQAEEYRDWLCPLPGELKKTSGTLEIDGVTVGLRIRTACEDSGAAYSFLNYQEFPKENWFLCFGRGGYHLIGLENGSDNAALTVAAELLALK